MHRCDRYNMALFGTKAGYGKACARSRGKRAEDCCRAGTAREEAAPKHITLLHVHGDPLRFLDLAEKVDVRRFACAIVLCDAAWADPDLDTANGIALRTKVLGPPVTALTGIAS